MENKGLILENLKLLSAKEAASSVVLGIILIAIVILLLGASLFAKSEDKDNREDFLKKLKEKEKKLKEKEEKLNKIQEQLRGMR